MFTRFFPRFKSMSLIALGALVAAGFAARAQAQSARNLGDVVIEADLKNTPILVTGSSAELNTLADQLENETERRRLIETLRAL